MRRFETTPLVRNLPAVDDPILRIDIHVVDNFKTRS
jgi:hypothetical protein